MIKHLRPLAIFIFLLFAGDRIGAMLISAVLDHSKLPIAQLYAGKAAGDGILLGNSRAYRHLVVSQLSEQIGGQVIDLSYPGVSTRMSLALLEDYIERYVAPKFIFVEITSLLMEQNVVLIGRPFSARSNRLQALIRAEFPEFYYGGLLSHLFNFNNNFSINLAHKVLFPLPSTLLNGVLNKNKLKGNIRKGPNGYFNSRAENITALMSIMELAERHGMELRLVISPVIKEFANNNRFEEWRDETQEIAGDIKVWDYGIMPELTLKDFYDLTHLNASGVRKFMVILRRDGFFDFNVAAHNLFPASPSRPRRSPNLSKLQ